MKSPPTYDIMPVPRISSSSEIFGKRGGEQGIRRLQKKEILEEVHDVGESPNGLDGLVELIPRSDYFDCKSIQFLVF